jgi:hypothetical protein
MNIVGLCLESLHVQSRNYDISLEKLSHYDERKMEFASDKSHPNLHETNSTTFFKLVQINHLSIYWNPISLTLPEICVPYPISGGLLKTCSHSCLELWRTELTNQLIGPIIITYCTP